MSRLPELIRESRRIANELRRILLEHYGDEAYTTIVGRGVTDDVTRRVDELAEDYVVNAFRRTGLGVWVIGEEKGVYRLSPSPDYIVLLDPLDGSLNYASQIPFASISIVAYSVRGDIPLLHEAEYGLVAGLFNGLEVEYSEGRITYNGRVINEVRKRVSETRIVSAYFNSIEELSFLRNVFTSSASGFKLRIMGSASIEATLAALGFIDYFISLTGRLRNTDIALAVALALRLGREVLIDPPLEQLSVDDVKIVRRLVIGPKSDSVIEEIKRKWFPREK